MVQPKPVYDDTLTRASATRLSELVRDLPHPVALAGGHAVRYAAKEKWKEATGQEYFGSRDIDVIYFVDPRWSLQELEASAAAQAPKRIAELGYEPIAFHFQQLLDAQGNIIQQEPNGAIEGVSLFRLFIDPMVTEKHDALAAIWKTTFILDEPLLKEVFQQRSARHELPDLGKNVYLPATPYLVATKLNSAITRTQDDKIVKDLCDLFALVNYGGVSSVEIRKTIHRILDDVPGKVRFVTTNPHLPKALEHLDVSRNDFTATIGPLAVP